MPYKPVLPVSPVSHGLVFVFTRFCRSAHKLWNEWSDVYDFNCRAFRLEGYSPHL